MPELSRLGEVMPAAAADELDPALNDLDHTSEKHLLPLEVRGVFEGWASDLRRRPMSHVLGQVEFPIVPHHESCRGRVDTLVDVFPNALRVGELEFVELGRPVAGTAC